MPLWQRNITRNKRVATNNISKVATVATNNGIEVDTIGVINGFLIWNIKKRKRFAILRKIMICELPEVTE